MGRIDVGVLGATGMVGQQFAVQLTDHPWFSLSWVAASERSEGKKYSDAAQWRLPERRPDGLGALEVQACRPGRGPKIVFSALDAGVAGDLERGLRRGGAYRGEQRAELPDGARRTVARPRGQR